MTTFSLRIAGIPAFLLLLLYGCQPAKHLPRDTWSIAFYNVENLFDTEDDPLTRDEEFTPGGALRWDNDRYQAKCRDLARVIEAMGHPVLIGLAEVENRSVLEDLIRQPALVSAGYAIAHFDSPDARGIDVALLYRKKSLQLLSSTAIPVEIGTPTRDILYAALRFGSQDTLHVLVNHWPSRRGGVEASAKKRQKAALTLARHCDSLTGVNPQNLLVVMGDFNDTPTDPSVRETLQADWPPASGQRLHNPFLPLALEGSGSYHYKNNWDMLDHIMLSPAWLSSTSRWGMPTAEVFREDWMMYQDKKRGPTPNRTYGGPNYFGGVSDHLPVRLLFPPSGQASR